MRKRVSFALSATHSLGDTLAAPLRSSNRRCSFRNVLGVPSNWPGYYAAPDADAVQNTRSHHEPTLAQ
jgi:hypothetical protein